jgi:hypothetical protein
MLRIAPQDKGEEPRMSQGEPMLGLMKHVGGRRERVEISANHLVIAGWTGRETAGLQHHIDDLKALGVKPPSSVPSF